MAGIDWHRRARSILIAVATGLAVLAGGCGDDGPAYDEIVSCVREEGLRVVDDRPNPVIGLQRAVLVEPGSGQAGVREYAEEDQARQAIADLELVSRSLGGDTARQGTVVIAFTGKADARVRSAVRGCAEISGS